MNYSYDKIYIGYGFFTYLFGLAIPILSKIFMSFGMQKNKCCSLEIFQNHNIYYSAIIKLNKAANTLNIRVNGFFLFILIQG